MPIARLRRLPVRWRLTLVFASVSSLALAAIGLFLTLHFRSGLDSGLNDSMRARATDVVTLVGRPGGLSQARKLVEGSDSDVQVIDATGRLLLSSTGTAQPFLRPAERGRAVRHEVLADRGEQQRVLARPARVDSRPAAVAVRASLGERERALETLNGVLIVGGPLVVVLASLAGYLVTAAALSPVEQMRRRARSISRVDDAARLPVGSADDEIRRLGTTLNEMLDRLHDSARRERAFLADASHELRTPLAVLRTELDVALRGDANDSRAMREALAAAGEETHRLTALAEDLLVLARADDGVLQLDRRPLDGDDLVAAVVRRFAGRARAAGRDLVAGEPTGAAVSGDRHWLEQALGDLVDNALVHGAGQVRVRVVATEHGAEFRVTDEGSGFPDDFTEQAFERFSRGPRARGGTGSGLGLAVVQAVATAHGGRARLANRAVGTEVWLELPATG